MTIPLVPMHQRWRFFLYSHTHLKRTLLMVLPEHLDVHAVYLMGEGPHRWFVAFICPCGCGATVQMSLLPDAIPTWQFTEHADTTVSLHPSVWREASPRRWPKQNDWVLRTSL